MISEPNWKPEACDDVDMLKEIARLMGGWWQTQSGHAGIVAWLEYDREAWTDGAYKRSRNDILASARAFGWRFGFYRVVHWVNDLFKEEWCIERLGNDLRVFRSTEILAHLEMVSQAAAHRDKERKPTREEDAEFLRQFILVYIDADEERDASLAALGRLAKEDK